MVDTRVANYLIQQKLGQGGMGVVYKAIDLNLDRPVAVKVLTPELARERGLVERFRHEAKALANLNHTNIATLYSLQESAGQYFMIMEYLEGDTFDQLIQRRSRIASNDAIRWFKQALLGIGFAHRSGIVHRDIKPANIILTNVGIVKVMDFGIAKVLGNNRLTSSGTQMGTAAYMSPEQIRKEPVDARSDIYSLSVTLFEMVTGNLPFSCASDFEMMSAHLRMTPPRPSRFCADIPPVLEDAILLGLEKKPADRFQTAEAFGAALEKSVKPPPVRSEPMPVINPPEPVMPRRVSPRPLVPRPSPPRPSPPRAAPPPRSVPPRASIARKTRYHTSGPLCLTLGIVIVFCLFFGGLYRESVGLLLACGVLFYFLPILIAAMLLKRNGAAVVKLNALRGWTGIGWIEAMKQALLDDER